MVARLAKTFSAGLMVAVLAGAWPAESAGWPLPNPLSFTTKKEAKSKKPVKKEPSALDKISTGTKKFFGQVGETLGLKKPKPRKPTVAYPRLPDIQPQKKESKSWLPPWLRPQEPQRPRTVSDWIEKERLDP